MNIAYTYICVYTINIYIYTNGRTSTRTSEEPGLKKTKPGRSSSSAHWELVPSHARHQTRRGPEENAKTRNLPLITIDCILSFLPTNLCALTHAKVCCYSPCSAFTRRPLFVADKTALPSARSRSHGRWVQQLPPAKSETRRECVAKPKATTEAGRNRQVSGRKPVLATLLDKLGWMRGNVHNCTTLRHLSMELNGSFCFHIVGLAGQVHLAPMLAIDRLAWPTSANKIKDEGSQRQQKVEVRRLRQHHIANVEWRTKFQLPLSRRRSARITPRLPQ